MKESEFEASLERLYARVPSSPDDDEFVRKLQKRLALLRWYRTSLLCLLGMVGGIVTARWLVDYNFMPFMDIARLPLDIVEGASSSRIALVLVLAFAARVTQLVTRKL